MQPAFRSVLGCAAAQNGIKTDSNHKSYAFSFSLSHFVRWMLWLYEKANDRRWLGMGLVASDRRSAPLARGDDTQPDVRNGGNGPGCRPYRDRGGPV